MKNSNKEKGINILWSILSSVKLTLILLIILAITSIAGTLIPQQEGAIEFARGLSPGLLKLFRALQLFDMYHSFWFRLIIGFLAFNLVVCSIDRFPATLKVFRTVPKPDRMKPFENVAPERNFLVEGKTEDIADDVTELLRTHYKKIQCKNTEKGHFFYGEKGRRSYFGVYLVHLSILIILIGAIIGSLFGFEAYVNIAEGETVDTVRLRKNNIPRKLNFSVHCEKFTVDFYDNGTPKEYRSDIRFINDGKTERKGSLLVNHPMTYRGITFYQASYGSIPGDKVRLNVRREGNESKISTLEVETGKPTPFPANDGQFVVTDIRDDFMRMGPAARIVIAPPEGEEIHIWLFQHHEMITKRFPGIFEKFPKLNPGIYKPYVFSLVNIENIYYTGLQVNKDPGVSLVWIGCFIMVAGFFITFFMSHRRIRVRVSKTKGKTRICVTGMTNKNPVGLERELEQITHTLRNELS